MSCDHPSWWEFLISKYHDRIFAHLLMALVKEMRAIIGLTSTQWWRHDHCNWRCCFSVFRDGWKQALWISDWLKWLKKLSPLIDEKTPLRDGTTGSPRNLGSFEVLKNTASEPLLGYGKALCHNFQRKWLLQRLLTPSNCTWTLFSGIIEILTLSFVHHEKWKWDQN